MLKCQDNTDFSHNILTGRALIGGFSCLHLNNKALVEICYINNVDTECNGIYSTY